MNKRYQFRSDNFHPFIYNRNWMRVLCAEKVKRLGFVKVNSNKKNTQLHQPLYKS